MRLILDCKRLFSLTPLQCWWRWHWCEQIGKYISNVINSPISVASSMFLWRGRGSKSFKWLILIAISMKFRLNWVNISTVYSICREKSGDYPHSKVEFHINAQKFHKTCSSRFTFEIMWLQSISIILQACFAYFQLSL